ncbi:MAG: alpha/beta fold hydrolase [Alphaproteobacteria bacterium]|nr:alpha/beta fold hydrolase [Alphaproteobacteria bacterium]
MSDKDHSYIFEGGPVGILLIHGLCGSPTELRYVANGLARKGYTVLCPQLAGHCAGDADLRDSTWNDWYHSAEQGLKDLSKRCETVIVGGLSTGALLAMLLAHEHQAQVQGLTLFSPTFWLTGRQVPWYAKFFNLVPHKALANLINFPAPHRFGIKDARIRDFIRKALKAPGAPEMPIKTPGAAVLERRWLAKKVAGIVRHIKQPTLIVHPREDDYAGMDNAFFLQKTLLGHVDMVVLEDSYHIVTIDRQRDIVLQRTQQFLARLTSNLQPEIKSAPQPTLQAAA